MKNYPDFIENQMKDQPNDELTFSYKRSVLEAMEKRSALLHKRGLDDENVIIDLVCSENMHIEQGYFDFLAKEKDKKRIRNLPRNIGIYMLALVIAFLGIGFATSVWHPTWLIIEGGVSLMVVYLLVFLASHLTDTPFYPIARLCVAGSVMVLAQFIFLVIRLPFGVENAYLLFLAAVALMLLGDGILASLTKQKFAFLSWLLYIPAVTGLLYALLGLAGFIAWNPGWWMMVAAVVADILLVLGTVLYKGRYSIKQELENIWKED
ncbi:MAG: hypothetical protein E7523_10590 [Ruminococcaceae bacterium]|nr:hypothetical protein [Oscillospiraceae bacterium]